MCAGQMVMEARSNDAVRDPIGASLYRIMQILPAGCRQIAARYSCTAVQLCMRWLMGDTTMLHARLNHLATRSTRDARATTWGHTHTARQTSAMRSVENRPLPCTYRCQNNAMRVLQVQPYPSFVCPVWTPPASASFIRALMRARGQRRCVGWHRAHRRFEPVSLRRRKMRDLPTRLR